MTCDAMSPLEYGSPGSRSEITMCGILVPFSVTALPRRSSFSGSVTGLVPCLVRA